MIASSLIPACRCQCGVALGDRLVLAFADELRVFEPQGDVSTMKLKGVPLAMQVLSEESNIAILFADRLEIMSSQVKNPIPLKKRARKGSLTTSLEPPAPPASFPLSTTNTYPIPTSRNPVRKPLVICSSPSQVLIHLYRFIIRVDLSDSTVSSFLPAMPGSIDSLVSLSAEEQLFLAEENSTLFRYNSVTEDFHEVAKNIQALASSGKFIVLLSKNQISFWTDQWTGNPNRNKGLMKRLVKVSQDLKIADLGDMPLLTPTKKQGVVFAMGDGRLVRVVWAKDAMTTAEFSVDLEIGRSPFMLIMSEDNIFIGGDRPSIVKLSEQGSDNGETIYRTEITSLPSITPICSVAAIRDCVAVAGGNKVHLLKNYLDIQSVAEFEIGKGFRIVGSAGDDQVALVSDRVPGCSLLIDLKKGEEIRGSRFRLDEKTILAIPGLQVT